MLSSQPIYLLTVLKLTKEVLEEIDRVRKRFLWAGDKELSGGKCKINWTRTSLPKEHGSLGILNLEKFARALRLRWLWHEWVSLEKAWVGTETSCDESDWLLFAACTKMLLGNGKKTFWSAGWIQGRRRHSTAAVHKVKQKEKKGCGCPAQQ